MSDKEYYINQEGDCIFYVYIHRRLSDNKPFYVGKGKGKRAWRTDRNNPHWQSVRKKHGFKVEIVFDHLDEETAFQCEKDTILELRYFGYPLTNMTDGGDGQAGRVWTDEMRKKASESQRTSEKVKEGRLKTSAKMRGIKRGPQPKISAALRGKPKTAEHVLAAGAAKRSSIVYEFINIETEEIFCGTRYEMQEFHNIDRLKISSLFGSRPNIVSVGWCLVGEFEEVKHDPDRFSKALERGRNNKKRSSETREKMSSSHLAFRAKQRLEREFNNSSVEEL